MIPISCSSLSKATPFFLIRENRKIWIAGQFLYIVGACVCYLMFILGSTGLLCMNYLFSKNTWSYTAAMLAYSEKGETLGIPAAVKTLEMSRPYQTMCCIFALLLLYALVLMFLQMFFTLWKGQLAGVISALTFSAYGLLLNPDNLKTIMDENLKNLNNSVAAYEKISKIQLYPTEFEKTPKRSIKRYLYNSITID